jgi:hypothetical protein
MIPEFDSVEDLKGTVPQAFKLGSPNSYSRMYISTAGGNCKLCHISDIGFSLDKSNIESTVETLNKLFSRYDKLCFEVNVSFLKHIDALNKYFRLVSCVEVPIGYDQHGGITYFAVFLTNNGFRSGGVSHSVVMERLSKPRLPFNYECSYRKSKEEVEISKVIEPVVGVLKKKLLPKKPTKAQVQAYADALIEETLGDIKF